MLSCADRATAAVEGIVGRTAGRTASVRGGGDEGARQRIRLTVQCELGEGRLGQEPRRRMRNTWRLRRRRRRQGGGRESWRMEVVRGTAKTVVVTVMVRVGVASAVARGGRGAGGEGGEGRRQRGWR